MIPFKNRTIDYNNDVLIYRNLNKKGKVFSVKQGNLVVAHTKSIKLINCNFIINKAGQLRVRRKKRKNVHAYIKGRIVNGFFHNMSIINNILFDKEIVYNPYLYDYFCIKDLLTEKIKPIKESKYLMINDGKVWIGSKIKLAW